jgi:flagellar motor protein MotB
MISNQRVKNNKQWTGAMYLIVMVFTLIGLVSCVTTGAQNKAIDERDALIAENEELEGRIQLLRSRIANINHEVSFQGTIIQIQEDIIKVGADVVKGQDAKLQQQSAIIRSAAEVIRTQDQALKVVQRTYDTLVAVLEPQVGDGTVVLKIENGILLVNLAAEILFPSGSAELSNDGNMVIGKVAEGIGRIPYQVVVAGYTDNVPIGKKLSSRFANNWELAGARSAKVVSLLEEIGIESRRLISISFGENHAVASNDTAEGRAKNRRIEFRVIPIVTVQ